MSKSQTPLYKKIKKILWILVISILFLITASYFYVDSFSRYCFDDFSQIAHNHVGLLLGTSPHLADGRNNLFFIHRINAAAKLFNENKIDYILISGDNRTQHYNEPVAMQEALMKKGIPEEKLVLDYAGFRTLDSVVRAKKVFGQKKLTIISQPFHCERAILIAHHYNIDAICANAKDVPIKVSPRVRLRELLARVKVVLDIYILKTEPKFLGEKIEIE